MITKRRPLKWLAKTMLDTVDAVTSLLCCKQPTHVAKNGFQGFHDPLTDQPREPTCRPSFAAGIKSRPAHIFVQSIRHSCANLVSLPAYVMNGMP